MCCRRASVVGEAIAMIEYGAVVIGLLSNDTPAFCAVARIARPSCITACSTALRVPNTPVVTSYRASPAAAKITDPAHAGAISSLPCGCVRCLRGMMIADTAYAALYDRGVTFSVHPADTVCPVALLWM